MINTNSIQWLLGSILLLSSLGVIIVRKPVHACLCFLVTLLMLAALYLQLDAQFISVMQVLVYAGAILVIFIFVMMLFQDAHQKIDLIPGKSAKALLFLAGASFPLALLFLGKRLLPSPILKETVLESFGTVEGLGRALYIDFFFPFEAVVLLFLIAVVGALYIAKKEK